MIPKTRMLPVAVVSALIALTGCAAGPQAGPETAAISDDGLDCRREAPTGSRLGRRVCMSAEQRERIEQESRESLERMQRTGSLGATKDGG